MHFIIYNIVVNKKELLITASSEKLIEIGKKLNNIKLGVSNRKGFLENYENALKNEKTFNKFVKELYEEALRKNVSPDTSIGSVTLGFMRLMFELEGAAKEDGVNVGYEFSNEMARDLQKDFFDNNKQFSKEHELSKAFNKMPYKERMNKINRMFENALNDHECNDCVHLANVLEEKHKSRGFFDRLFNRARYKEEDEILKNMQKEISKRNWDLAIVDKFEKTDWLKGYQLAVNISDIRALAEKQRDDDLKAKQANEDLNVAEAKSRKDDLKVYEDYLKDHPEKVQEIDEASEELQKQIAKEIKNEVSSQKTEQKNNDVNLKKEDIKL